MPSAYLVGSTDLNLYGVPNATASQVALASTLIDGYLQRPEGMIYGVDGNQNPCYMVAKTASLTLTSTTAISPGQNVNVTVTGSTMAVGLGSSQCGLVAIVDRGTSSITEAVIVQAITGNVIQLANVQFSHSIGALFEFDLVIYEECQMPAGRPITNVSKTPVRIILGGQGRYGYARRGNSNAEINEYNLLAAITMFGGPPVWEIFNQTLVGVDPNTGQLWAPAGILLAYYTEIRFSYIAGWTYAGLPPAIKLACAKIITASNNFPLTGQISNYRAGDTQINRFAASNFDDDTKAMLEPFMARQYV